MTDDHKNPTDPAGTAGHDGDEQALRSLLAGAVQGLEPSEDALERLRRAVPARRARKRQAVVGAAAAVLLAATAVPAALHLGGEQGTTTDHSAMAGHGQAQSGKTEDPAEPRHNGAGTGNQPRPTRSTGPALEDGTGEQPSPPAGGGSASGGVTAGPSGTGATAGAATGSGPGIEQTPPAAASGAVPACTSEQLGVRGSARAPESDGKVYGSFKVTNVSARGCTVTGPDRVTAASLATTPPAQGPAVTVTGHREGDPASGLLPAPSAETPQLVLDPNSAYEVRFAWVPTAESCPAATPNPSGKPVEQGGPAQGPAGSTDPAAAGEAGASPAAEADPLSGSTAPDPAGVEVSHTPSTPLAGAPVTHTTIPAACGGTVYRTGIIAPAAP
ncbi:hypothetical protein NJL88_17590 [Streptomyces sp. DK15]|uniref:hypothetical protein n=1 Tax=Streptomyces sp. DK15 TaxID=2957499 RepID=UPI0029BF8B00|nr:hypothetical protein [Streptomyces sp. DK15]MDX2391831.1 hypothetical protein [Streptomyces sp. DK15]